MALTMKFQSGKAVKGKSRSYAKVCWKSYQDTNDGNENHMQTKSWNRLTEKWKFEEKMKVFQTLCEEVKHL